MEKETANKYIFFLIITFFIAIYIICLVYLFKKESEISSIILLIIYQTMMMFYLIHKASISNFGIKTIIWNAALITTILNFVSLLLIIVTYQHLYKEYNLDGDKTLSLSKGKEALINKFKIFLLVSIVLMMVLIIINIFDIFSGGLFGKFVLFVSSGIIISMLSISSYNLYIANEIFKLKKTKVISR